MAESDTNPIQLYDQTGNESDDLYVTVLKTGLHDLLTRLTGAELTIKSLRRTLDDDEATIDALSNTIRSQNAKMKQFVEAHNKLVNDLKVANHLSMIPDN